jgi:circadian clock protein KaiC
MVQGDTPLPYPTLPKAPTGISGFDTITGGGLPRGRPSLICGSAGCGKTLFAMEFLVRGAVDYDEPGVFLSFEETETDLSENTQSLGFDLPTLVEDGRLVVDHVRVERTEIAETGEYDLEALFLRLGYDIDSIGAKRVVLDTLEVLFSGLTNTGILRAELRRLFRWLKDRGVTTIITAERGDGQLTRHGLEEYVSDCVILLDHRVTAEQSTRRLRVVKYRGSLHGTNEYPFIIDQRGIAVLPLSSVGLDHAASEERISTGIPDLDAMLGGKGYYRGSSIMVTGTPGTGKTSLAAYLASAACRRGERVLYFAFEESEEQMLRNMRSIGLDLRESMRDGLLQFRAARPSLHGLEAHLVEIIRQVTIHSPSVVIVDPFSSFLGSGSSLEVRSMLLRMIDFLKSQGITAFFTAQTTADGTLEDSRLQVSSIIDTWLLVRDIELAGERNRGLYVLKSRGMAHSNQVREFVITADGIALIETYAGLDGILTGSMRVAQQARERAADLARHTEEEQKRKEFDRRRVLLAARMTALRAEQEQIEDAEQLFLKQREQRQDALDSVVSDLRRRRLADVAPREAHPRNGTP